MSGAIYQAASGAVNYQMNLEILANNLANVNTVGFKAENAVFRLPDRTDTQPGAGEGTNDPARLFLSLIPPATATDFSQGQLQETGNPLDVSLSGSGFFSIQTPDGTNYTRKGSFTLDGNGRLVTSEGYPVLGDGGEITIRGERITIGQDGTIMADGTSVGKFRLVDFPDNNTLRKSGNNLFAKTDPTLTESPAGDAIVNQGFIERSNVDMIRVMTEMIEVSRGFQSYQKMIQALDETRGKAVNELGRLA